jgi:DNA-binding PucR family transcriptional regulator
LLPDQQVGIVAVPTQKHRSSLVEILRRETDIRLGVSPPYQELTDTGTALRLARLAMTGTRPPGGVTVFDDAPLSIAAVSDPDIMRRVADTVFGTVKTMRDEDRRILIDTLDAWLNYGGSADAASAVLFCHPNTVRQRLRRIEERTGRSLSDPRQLTEMCLALETLRRLDPVANRHP